MSRQHIRRARQSARDTQFGRRPGQEKRIGGTGTGHRGKNYGKKQSSKTRPRAQAWGEHCLSRPLLDVNGFCYILACNLQYNWVNLLTKKIMNDLAATPICSCSPCHDVWFRSPSVCGCPLTNQEDGQQDTWTDSKTTTNWGWINQDMAVAPSKDVDNSTTSSLVEFLASKVDPSILGWWMTSQVRFIAWPKMGVVQHLSPIQPYPYSAL